MNVYRKVRIVLILLLERELHLQLMLENGSIKKEVLLKQRKELKLIGYLKLEKELIKELIVKLDSILLKDYS